ncbi:response regulator [Mucilaginibacter sp. CAU 1740]|uniref:response regulator n=1 Tax=Mucilaginibacter sp. CAU 1740 TaxID=3140365 RepID=UPI00325AE34C
MRKRILIFDDDVAVLEVLQMVLDYEGFEADIIEKTGGFLSLVRFYQPSLILLDFSLKGLSGGDWCALLKKSTEFKAIPVILLTAYSNKGLEKGTYGCDDFIAKPFNVVDLISRINLLTDSTHELLSKKEHNEKGTKVY